MKLDDNILSMFSESKNEYNDKPFNTKIKVRLDKELINDVESITTL